MVLCRIVEESEGKGKSGKEGMVRAAFLGKDGDEQCTVISDKHQKLSCKVSSSIKKDEDWLDRGTVKPFS